METAAHYEADAALREGLFGHAAQADKGANAALKLSTDRDTQYGAALAMAFAAWQRDHQIEKLANDLSRRFPEDTSVQFNYLPTLRAQVALSHNDPSKAIEILQVASPYALGFPGAGPFMVSLYPVYVRGQAYLALNEGKEAAAEFAYKILDHRSIVQNGPIGALARLGLARAYALQGDKDKARVAFRDFLTLWKDADPDIPILRQANAEYAKLR